jgi:hypothetical protein
MTIVSGTTVTVTNASGDIIESGGTEIVFQLFGGTASSLNPTILSHLQNCSGAMNFPPG